MDQTLQLVVGDRWRLVQSLLSSIQQETLVPSPPTTNATSLASLDPWTESLIGVIQLGMDWRTLLMQCCDRGHNRG